MHTLTINLDTPLLPEALADEARRLEAEIANSRRLVRRTLWRIGSTITAALIAALWLYWAGVIELHVVMLLAAVAAGVAAASRVKRVGFEEAMTTGGVVAIAAAVAVGAAGVTAVAASVVAMVAAVVTVLTTVTVEHHLRPLVDKREELSRALAALDLIDPAECPQTLEWCQAHSELASYQAKVAAMPRCLVKGEVDAMRDWVANTAARTERARLQAHQQAAYDALRAPVVLGS